MRIVLEVSSINYSRLGSFLASKTSGIKSLGISSLFAGLECMNSSDAEAAIVKGADLFDGTILNVMNNVADEFGVKFGSVTFK